MATYTAHLYGHCNYCHGHTQAHALQQATPTAAQTLSVKECHKTVTVTSSALLWMIAAATFTLSVMVMLKTG